MWSFKFTALYDFCKQTNKVLSFDTTTLFNTANLRSLSRFSN